MTTERQLDRGWTVRQVDAPSTRYSDAGAPLPAQVPGHVHLDLHRAGVIPDPFERMYERAVAWVDDADWLYECTFAVDELELAGGGRALLRFEGLDTVADVRLDGELIGSFDNMHVPHEIDVSGRLGPGVHVLEVQFSSALRVGLERRQALLEARPELEPFQTGLTPRTMVRKAQYHFGWDWGPVLRGCGIWKPVTLVSVPRARIARWRHDVSFGAPSAAAKVALQIEADGPASAMVATLRGPDGAPVASASAPVESGASAVVLPVPAPERWWPNGYGEPALYDLEMTLLDGDAVVDVRRARIGLRTVELVTDLDAAGATFHFRVNGVPVYAKGANWIPDDSFPARSTRDRIGALVRMASDCGMNMLRIWGGGLYESEEFYDACDELGILVWQDFAYACAFYPEDGDAAEVAAQEARSVIERLRHRASLALWCGNNENQWLGRLDVWGAVPRVLGERLYDEVLPAVVADLDPSRPYWPGSPWGGDEPNSQAAGDCHDWNVWHGAGDWRHYEECRARFVSEFGFSAPPALATLGEFLDEADLGVDTPAMRWHDKTAKGYETYLGYIALHYPEPATIDDLVYYGQCNQADAMRFGIEHFRRLRPHNMGTLVWQLNDCWPVQSWAWVDYRLRPKAAWYAAKRLYAPLLVSLWHDGGRAHVHLVNDAPEPVAGRLVVRAVEAGGTERWRTERDATAPSMAALPVADEVLPAEVIADAASLVLQASFAGSAATALLCEPRDLVLPVPELEVSAVDVASTSPALRLTLRSDTIAVSLVLWLEGLDARWSDNFLTLLPGEPVDVEVQPAVALSPAELRESLRWRSVAGGGVVRS